MTPREKLAEIDAQIEALEEQKRAIYQASVEAPEAEKVCADFMAEMLAQPSLVRSITYPITVSGITGDASPMKASWQGNACGSPVAVRPCDPECAGKTYLGFYMGDLAMSVGASYHAATGVLNLFCAAHNPAMWVPALGRIVMGCGSWWGPIKSPEDLRQITDEDISGVWYVQAMKALTSAG